MGDWMEGKMVYGSLKERKWQSSKVDYSCPEKWCDRDTIGSPWLPIPTCSINLKLVSSLGQGVI